MSTTDLSIKGNKLPLNLSSRKWKRLKSENKTEQNKKRFYFWHLSFGHTYPILFKIYEWENLLNAENENEIFN